MDKVKLDFGALFLRPTKLFPATKQGLVTIILVIVVVIALNLTVIFTGISTLVFTAMGALALLACTLSLPRHWLPGMALALFVLLPITYMPSVNPVFGRYLAPALGMLLIWMLRSIGKPQGTIGRVPKLWTWIACLLLGLSTASAAWSLDPARSLFWTFTVGIAFIGFAWMGQKADHRSVASLTATWLSLGLFIGAMAIAEGVTSTSFLQAIYANQDSSGIGFNQLWSTFRVTTTLGHPLMNATFLATTSAFGIMHAARTNSKLALVSGVLCGAGAVLTVSRSAVGALAAGLCLGLITVLTTKSMSFGRKAFWTLGAVAAAWAVATTPIVQERSASAEGEGSSRLRSILLDLALDAAASDGFTGSGAGSSAQRSVLAGITLPFENSYAGVLVSLGIAGLALMMVLMLGLLIIAVVQNNPAGAAALATFSIQISAYPLVDNVPISMIMLGALAYLVFGTSASSSSNTETLGAMTGHSPLAATLRR
ncbi:hypothetical protein ACX80V_08460 [Arthrobacter sp. MDT3-24]